MVLLFSLLMSIAPLSGQGLILICHLILRITKNVREIIQVIVEVCNPNDKNIAKMSFVSSERVLTTMTLSKLVDKIPWW
jgi:hypothetical protein